MPERLDDFVCDVQCEDYYDDFLTEEEWSNQQKEFFDIFQKKML